MKILQDNIKRLFGNFAMYSLALSDIIEYHPLTVSPDTPVLDVLALMSSVWGSYCQVNQVTNENLSCNPTPDTPTIQSCALITEGSKLIGVFTERDVVRLIAEGEKLVGVSVGQIISKQVYALKQNEFRDVFTVISLLEKYQIRHLPVVDDVGNLVGVITPTSVRSVLQAANLLMMRTVDEVMNTTVIHAFADTSVLGLAQLMAENHVSCVVICDSIKVKNITRLLPIGIVTERDIVQFQVLELDITRIIAADVMSQPLFCLQPTDTLWIAHQQMQQRRIRRLVVVGIYGELLGIVTQTSILRSLEPMQMYRLIESLQTEIYQLEAEKVELLENRNHELEELVKSRTLKLQQQAERELLVSTVAQRIRQSLNLQEILDTTVTEVRQLLKCDRVLVYRFQPDLDSSIMAESVENFLSLLETKFRDTYFQNTRCSEYLRGDRQVIANIYNFVLSPCHLELLEKLEVKAILSIPIIINEKLWGLLVAHQCSNFRQWHQEEIDLLEQISVQITIAIVQATALEEVQTQLQERQRAEAALQQLNEELEMRVDERTTELATTIERLHQEISERKKAEQALEESQRFIQRIADTNPNILYIYDLVEARNVYCNREVASALGYSPEKIQQMGAALFQDLMHPDDLIKVTEHHQQFATASDGKILEIEYRMKHVNGQWRWFYSWDTVFTRDANAIPTQILGTASDNTARKLAEEVLRQQIEREQLIGSIARRIRQSLDLETILKTTVEEVQELFKADRVLVYQILPNGCGYAIAEAVTPTFPQVVNTIFPEETLPYKCYQAYLQGRVYVLEDREKTQLIPCLYDLMKQMAVQAKLVVPIVQHDFLWGLLIVHQCVVPRHWQPWEIDLLQQLATQLAIAIQQSQLYKQLQLELNERQFVEERLRQNNEILANTNAELARATQLKDEFLANMSHELRTPLNAILGMSEGLLEEICGNLNSQQRKAVSTIEKSGKHLLELINDILDLAKIESGKVELKITSVPVTKLIESSLTFVKQQALQKNIRLSSRIPNILTEISVDERRMRQVLINLLSNAIKFTLEGGNVTVEVEEYIEDSFINFKVIDTGIGIAQEDMSKLFQSFVQIDSSLSRRYEGTGLGLALVRRITELHGGSVSIESEINKGSRFIVSLPKLNEQVYSKFDSKSSVNSASRVVNDSLVEIYNEKSVDLNTPLILLAEDNEANIDTIFTYLSLNGYRLILAKNGIEAVMMGQKYNPAIILMDVQMPEMDGLTATRQLRSNSETANIPIIALTSLAMPGDREKCLEAGATEYMTKPVSLKELIKNIKDLLTTS